MTRHWAFFLLLAAFGALAGAFAVQDVLPTVGDDSVDLIALARFLGGTPGSDPLVEWGPSQAHFPPLFPALLALTGGAHDLRAGYALVVSFAVVALALLYAYARAALEDGRAALGVVAAFIVLPTAWITLKGVLTETTYLAFTLGVLWWHERHGERVPARWADALVLGLLLGAAWLTRAAGITLVAAYALHVAIGAWRARRAIEAPALASLAVPAILMGGWMALRPAPDDDAYRGNVLEVASMWANDPAGLLVSSAKALSLGWLASFGADGASGAPTRAILAVLAAIAVAGTILRAARNRLDGWYVLAYLGLVFVWAFPDESRRLLYPVVPLLVVHGAQALREACAATGRAALAGRALAAAALLLAALTAPALVVFAHKAFDRTPVLAGYGYVFADMREYYEVVDADHARGWAKLQVEALAGLEALRRVTPPDARVMWMRPEYVAFLGGRKGVAYYASWDEARLFRELRERQVDYVVWSRIFKADLARRPPDPAVLPRSLAKVAAPAFGIGGDFVLYRVDRARLEAASR